MTTSIRFLRLPATEDRVGLKSSKLYERMADGTMPRPIKIGGASVWAEHEIDELNAAILAGATDDQLRKLVRDQIARRHVTFKAMSADAASAPA